MATSNPISASRGDSAFSQGAPPKASQGALYSPAVGPAQRKMLDADRLRKARLMRPRPKPVAFDPPVAVVKAAPVEPPKPMPLKQKLSILRAAVAAEFGITGKDILDKSKKDFICRPRQLFMFLCLDVLKMGYSQTGRKMGRDHTTIWHAERVIRRRLLEPEYAARVDRLRAEVIARFG